VTTWLLTGVTGFLGANLAQTLPGDVVGLTRQGSHASRSVRTVTGDLLDAASLRSAVADAQPDVIVNAAGLADHAACLRDEDLAHRVNAEAAGVLAEIASDAGARFIQISTDAVFDGQRGAYRETDEANPVTAYGRSKRAGEERVVNVNPDSLIVRTNFFGWSPTGKRSVLEFFVGSLGRGERVRGFTNYRVTSLWVDEVARALVDLVEKDAMGVVHLSSADSLSKEEFGRLVASEFGFDASLIDPSIATFESGVERQDLSLDTTKVSELLGREMLTQSAGIKQAHQARATRSFR
jgi:dTDP-4-dehydrorhamnose reductase